MIAEAAAAWVPVVKCCCGLGLASLLHLVHRCALRGRQHFSAAVHKLQLSVLQLGLWGVQRLLEWCVAAGMVCFCGLLLIAPRC